MDQQFYCDHEGCLFWPEQKCLIVSDLHLEKAAAFASGGSMLPPYDTRATLARLQNCIQHWQPQTVISLGDSFHRDNSADQMCAEDRDHLRSVMQDLKWVWIAGNHDPQPPSGFGGIYTEEYQIGELCFRHHQLQAQPSDTANITGEVSGHLHPVAVIKRRGKTMRRKCFASDGHRLIMPAFGAFTGGLNVKSQPFAGIFNTQSLKVWMLGRDRVYEFSSRDISA